MPEACETLFDFAGALRFSIFSIKIDCRNSYHQQHHRQDIGRQRFKFVFGKGHADESVRLLIETFNFQVFEGYESGGVT